MDTLEPDVEPVVEIPAYSEHFAHNIALSLYDPDIVCDSFGVDRGALDLLMQDPGFQEAIARYQVTFQEEGVTAQTKARMAVELMIPHMVKLGMRSYEATDTQKIFDSLAKVGNMYSKGMEVGDGSATGFMLSINLSAGVEPEVVDVTPVKSSMPLMDLSEGE